MLAGNLMGAGGLAKRIINLARALVGHLRGGLANVTVVSNMFMGGISGSSVADCSALGTILIPAMQKQGYPPVCRRRQRHRLHDGHHHSPEHPDDPDGGGHEPLHPRPLLRGARAGPADRPGDAGDHDVHFQAKGLPEIPPRHRPRAAGGVLQGVARFHHGRHHPDRDHDGHLHADGGLRCRGPVRHAGRSDRPGADLEGVLRFDAQCGRLLGRGDGRHLDGRPSDLASGLLHDPAETHARTWRVIDSPTTLLVILGAVFLLVGSMLDVSPRSCSSGRSCCPW